MSKKNIIIPVIILALIGLGGLGWFYRDKLFPSPSKPERVYKVGVILLGGIYNDSVQGTIDEMKNLGYVSGENIIYDIKDTKGDNEAIAPATEELLRNNPDVIYAIATPVLTRVWKVVGDKLPIVFNNIGDPVGSKFVKSFASSENNLTGCSVLSSQLSGKRLEVFKESFPKIKKVITFYDPANSFSVLATQYTREAAPKLGIEVTEIHVKTVDDLKKALADIKPGQYEGIFVTPEAFIISKIELVITKAKELGLPVMAHEGTLADKGVTVTYGANFYKLGVQCASTLLYVLKGQKPQDIPIQAPRELEMVVNAKSAQESGFSIPSAVLEKADRVIR